MRYGDVLPSSFMIPTSAFWLRNDLEKHNPFEHLELPRSATVMDCGAYIGTFAIACVEQGAAYVTCYEAAPKNAAMLRQNCSRYQQIGVIEAALVASNDSTVSLNLSGFSGANSILPQTRRMKFIEVSAVNFRRSLLTLRPSVLKLDVEGAEYDLLASLCPGDLRSVRSLFIEFHPIANREQRIADVRRYLEESGLTVVSARKRAFTASR